MKELCATLQATCIECVCQDGTKISNELNEFFFILKIK